MRESLIAHPLLTKPYGPAVIVGSAVLLATGAALVGTALRETVYGDPGHDASAPAVTDRQSSFPAASTIGQRLIAHRVDLSEGESTFSFTFPDASAQEQK